MEQQRCLYNLGEIMAYQVPWNKIIVETFIEEAMLTKDEEWILRT